MKKVIILLFALSLVALVAIGCSKTTTEELPVADKQQTNVKAKEEQKQETDAPKEEGVVENSGDIKAQMMIANYIIAEQGVHLMAEELEKGNLDEGFLRKVQKAKATVESIEWSDEVKAEADTFLKDVTELEKALIANDVEAAKGPAEAAHESQHDLDKKVAKVVKEMTGGDIKAQMMIANYIIAEQGVHLMAEELEKGNLDEGFLRKVQKAKATVESIEWSDEVKAEADTFLKDVTELEKALIANDVEAAKGPAEAAHESQHDLDKKVAKVVKEMTGGDIKAQMMIANYIIAEQGVHLMAEELEKGNLDEGFLRKVQKAKATVESIEWSDEVKAEADTFLKDVTELEKALIANDVEAAKGPAEAAHESQHDLDKKVASTVMEMKSVSTQVQVIGSTAKNETSVEEEGIPLTIKDWGFENKLELKKGSNVVTVTNTGNMPHGVLIPELGFISEDIAAGETVTLEINAEKTGTFKFLCSVPECGTPEQHGGMIGEVVVQ